MNILKKLTLFKIINILARFILIFLILFLWIRYFVRNLNSALIISITATLTIEFILNIIFYKRKNGLLIETQEKTKIEECSLSFLFNDDFVNINFFYNLAKLKHSVIKTSRFIIINNENSKIVLFPFFTFNKFSPDDLINILNQIKNTNPTKLIICTNDIDSQTERLASKITDKKIILLDKVDTYRKLLIPYNNFPECKIKMDTNKKISIKELLSYSLNKKKTKGYLIGSIILLFSSFIVSFNIYYIVMSTILLLLSLVSFINPRFNKKLSENLFD